MRVGAHDGVSVVPKWSSKTSEPSDKFYMTNDNPSLAEASTIDEELVAYLDGELSRDQAARIERRMAEDPKYAARLNQLQRAWDLLDTLNRTEADDDFVHSTVEMVAVQAVEEAKTQKLRTSGGGTWAGWRWRSSCWPSRARPTASCRVSLPRPNRELVRNLPLIERVDDYQQHRQPGVRQAVGRRTTCLPRRWTMARNRTGGRWRICLAGCVWPPALRAAGRGLRRRDRRPSACPRWQDVG